MQNSNNTEISLDNDKKIEVLLHALDERYNSIHIIRERVQNISLWTLGLFITAGGWLIQSDITLTTCEKILYLSMVIASVVIVRCFYLSDLEKGFKSQQKIQAKIEKALGLCKPGVFISESLYPDDWSNAGTNKGKGNFFSHNYLLIYTGTFFLLLSIILK